MSTLLIFAPNISSGKLIVSTSLPAVSYTETVIALFLSSVCLTEDFSFCVTFVVLSEIETSAVTFFTILAVFFFATVVSFSSIVFVIFFAAIIIYLFTLLLFLILLLLYLLSFQGKLVFLKLPLMEQIFYPHPAFGSLIIPFAHREQRL